jgi:oligopeptide/dipeptide ABC transporter ATP-binding protein
MTKTILKIENLTVNFNTIDGIAKVLDRVDLSIDEGEVVGLIGESGCGKTVTGQTILNFLPVPPGEILDGKIFFDGENILMQPDHQRARLSGIISYIPQNPLTSLNPVFSIAEQMTDLIRYQARRTGILNVLRLLLGKHYPDVRDRAIGLLRKVEIPSPAELINRYPIELSGGMRQRVLIAMALTGDPSLLIADEPTTALDVTVQKAILKMFIEKIRSQNLAVLYITHNLGIAKMLCDRTYVMYMGTIVEVSDTAELLTNPKHPYSKGLIKSIPKLTREKYEGIMGMVSEYYTCPSGCRFHPRCGDALPICSIEKPSMIEFRNSHLVRCHLLR